MTEVRSNNLLEQFRKNWVVIAFIAGLIAGWTKIQSDIQDNNDDIQQVRVELLAQNLKIEAAQQQVYSVTGDIKEIKASLSFIRDRLTGN